MKPIKYIIITFAIIFIFNDSASAYIDPVSISSLLSLLVAATISGFYFLKFQIINFFKIILFFFKDISSLLKFLNKKKEVVFFYENKLYMLYLLEVITKFDLKESANTHILCKFEHESDCDIDERNIEISSFYTNFFLQIALNTIKCNILVTTTPDLNISSFKKSSQCHCYYYIFHSLVSTQMIYKQNAFTSFDVIACATKYQKKELENEEVQNNLPRKEILQSGYPFFSFLKKKKFSTSNNNQIIIAPSWVMDNKDYYEIYYLELIEKILQKNFELIFRPHPEFFKRNKSSIEKLEKIFFNYSNFKIDLSKSFDTLLSSKYLITDWSGIAFEYAYILKKPVIFFNTPRKINNSHTKHKLELQNQMVEVEKRENIGLIIDSPLEIFDSIQVLEDNKEKYQKSIVDFFENNLFNESNPENYIYENILSKNNFLKNRKS